MKFVANFGVLALIILFSCNSLLACDLKLLDILTAHWESDKEFSGKIASIASESRQLSLILSEFLQKNQKYHFPPKNINGKYVSTSIDAESTQAKAFVKEFGDQVALVQKQWSGIQSNASLFPDWVKLDKSWEQKCLEIEKQLEMLKTKLKNKEFLVLHESIATMYSQILLLLEQGQKDLVKRTLLTLSQDILLLIRGVELNDFANMKKASEMLKEHVDQLVKSFPENEIKALVGFKDSVYELNDVIKNDQLFKIVELAGAIEKQFGELTEEFSADYKIKNLSLY